MPVMMPGRRLEKVLRIIIVGVFTGPERGNRAMTIEEARAYVAQSAARAEQDYQEQVRLLAGEQPLTEWLRAVRIAIEEQA
jgi:hypothetical protein